MRLMYCDVCKTLDEIPNYDGAMEVDPLVEEVVMKHNKRDAKRHGWGEGKLKMRLVEVDDLQYAQNKDAVLKKLKEQGNAVGENWQWLGEAHNTFSDDAMACWNQHRQPKEGSPCIDYMSDAKRIGRPTEEGKEAVRANYKLGQTDPHLCQWCPYHSTVITNIRARKGMYKK